MKRFVSIFLIMILLCSGGFATYFLLSRNSDSNAKNQEKTVETVASSVWVKDGTGKSYLDKNGDKTVGFAEIDGKTYYFDEEGYLSRGWKETEKGDKCYVNYDGAIATGWKTIGDHIYFFDDDGIPYTGWMNYLSDRYYFNEDGALATGVTEINGTKYTFSDEGKLLTKEFFLNTVDEAVENDKDNIYGLGGFKLEPEDEALLRETIDEAGFKGRYNIGFVMINMYNGKGICYNVDTEVYSASCIKGPYIASLVDSRPETAEKNSNKFISIVRDSDNDLYSSSRKIYGREFFADWCKESDVPVDVATYNYPMITARELSKLWIQSYYFFNTDEDGEAIRDWYTTPISSAIYTTLGSESEYGYRTESKAGWICEKVYATTDGGIIYPDGKAPYIIAIISDIPSSMESLEPLCLELNEIYMKTEQ